jgi:Cytochrome c554 and c-prime
VTGLRGELEPCGCSGEVVGGLDRVAAAIASARTDRGDPLLIVAGDIVGPSAPTGADARARQEAAKAALFDRTLAAWRPTLVIEGNAGGGDRLPSLAHAGGASLIRAGMDVVIALTHTRADPLAGSTCKPDLWLHADRSDAPWQEDGVLHVGLDSPEQRVIAARLVPPPQPTGKRWNLEPLYGAASWQTPLGASAARDTQVRVSMDALFASFAEGQREVPAAEEGSHFVGSRTCAACHAGAYVWWRGTPHGHALQALEERGRQHDLACVGCHVTGFGEPGGSVRPPFGELASVGCESCHGASSDHADDPALAPGGGGAPMSERTCVRCHDAAHSAGFAFAAARAELDAQAHRVRHGPAADGRRQGVTSTGALRGQYDAEPSRPPTR